MKRISLAILASIGLGLILGALHISFATNSIISDKVYRFNNFISVFDASREKLNIVSKNILSNLAQDKDGAFIRDNNKDLKDLYVKGKINIVDATILQTISDLYDNNPRLINEEYNKELNYLSVVNGTLFYRIKPTNYLTFKNSIQCELSDYCALLYYNSKLSSVTYNYDILEDPSGSTNFTISRPIIKDGVNLGSLILDIPVSNIFNQHTFMNKEYYNGKNVYSFSSSDLPILQYQGDFYIDTKNIIRIKISYVDIWVSHSYLFVQYSALVFFILFLLLKKIELNRLTRNIVAGKESFYDTEFNKLCDDVAVYSYEITESRHLEDVIKANAENSLILVKYDLEEAKQRNVVPMAHAHMVAIIGSFIRASDYLIRNSNSDNELIILLPKCSTENAVKVLNKVLFRLGDDMYSEHELKLRASRIISNIQSSANIDSIVSIAQDEISKLVN
ncbi:hypothetical protein [Vibrio ziniensis]|uniref:GGDEF domain-containing protein n=1 Tax=Vibrio ziniensis TaxID=2711221 RepID=A0A6G7CHF1_9VIBR|nr:hypothetical protein [Vibrio ziniensis]QIH41504.1 hypothetical protein G5S32_05635 [Vibrio ziniensis]